MKAIEYRFVTVRYPRGKVENPALSDISFSVDPGERVALLGLNGSGKTTLLMAAVGLVGVQGDIFVSGLHLDRHTLPGVRAKVGFLFNVPEDQLLFPRVLDDVAFGLVRRGVGADEAGRKARETLKALGIDHLADRAPYELSHGQKQRVALAGALVTNPELLLLDEPSSGLDPPAKWQLADLLVRFPSAALVATHDIGFAKRSCTRYVLLEGGRLREEGCDFDRVERAWSGSL